MARYSEDAREYADFLRDKNRLKAQISGAGDKTIQIRKDDSGIINLIDINIIGKTRSVGHALILTHATNGKLGSPYLGVDGKQILIGDYRLAWVESVRRWWTYWTETDLNKGSYSENIDVSNGDIRIA